MEEETLNDYRKGTSVWTDYSCLSRVGMVDFIEQQCGAGKDNYLFIGVGEAI